MIISLLYPNIKEWTNWNNLNVFIKPVLNRQKEEQEKDVTTKLLLIRIYYRERFF